MAKGHMPAGVTPKFKRDDGYIIIGIDSGVIYFIILDIADGLVGVGLITSSEDSPGFLTLDKGYNDMSKFLNRYRPSIDL